VGKRLQSAGDGTAIASVPAKMLEPRERQAEAHGDEPETESCGKRLKKDRHASRIGVSASCFKKALGRWRTRSVRHA
jgi:hypothetical protein